MRRGSREAIHTVLRVLPGPCLLVVSSALVSAHDPGAHTSGPSLGFGVVVGLTVVLGILGGGIVIHWQRSNVIRRASVPGITLLLIVLGCWASVLALLEGPTIAAVGIAVGGLTTWSLRNQVVGGHHRCDETALGAVVLHRFVEGTLLATLYAANAAIGVGGAAILAAHTAGETGAIVGLWLAGGTKWKWGVVVLIQAMFVAGALIGVSVTNLISPVTHSAVLALVGGALIAVGVATKSRHLNVAPA